MKGRKNHLLQFLGQEARKSDNDEAMIPRKNDGKSEWCIFTSVIFIYKNIKSSNIKKNYVNLNVKPSILLRSFSI